MHYSRISNNKKHSLFRNHNYRSMEKRSNLKKRTDMITQKGPHTTKLKHSVILTNPKYEKTRDNSYDKQD